MEVAEVEAAGVVGVVEAAAGVVEAAAEVAEVAGVAAEEEVVVVVVVEAVEAGHLPASRALSCCRGS
jgi:hypothetical protein